MAYRKKAKAKKRTTRTRRRRMSGIKANSPLVLIAGAVGGYFLGPKLNDAITAKLKNADGTNKVDPKLIAAGEVLLGLFGPKLLGSKGNSLPVKLIGGVLAGAGAHLALKEFGVVSGFENVPMIAGYRDLRSIAGVAGPAAALPQSTRNGLSSLQVISGVTCNSR